MKALEMAGDVRLQGERKTEQTHENAGKKERKKKKIKEMSQPALSNSLLTPLKFEKLTIRSINNVFSLLSP
ncbi:hypothetical protein SLEP1_g3359 [Rubroshorea leprosula]|uniref:Uncharacterized protein n=1 Tax=Rubroshorea leprosula TaxID=152421 RepID=A0AAV5HSK0_9ROSI|nr:hypothetical protein SLEP1_g3359 [Rubroshorea leprosula]